MAKKVRSLGKGASEPIESNDSGGRAREEPARGVRDHGQMSYRVPPQPPLPVLVDGAFSYYLAWILLSYAMGRPWLLVGLGVLWMFQRYLPSPGALLRLVSRARKLRAQVELNRANITARRDLATIYLDGRRSRAAVQLLQEGLALAPDDAELLYLLGLAQHRTGQHEKALPLVVRAVEVDPRVRFGLPYLVAGDALFGLKRWDEALDAYERYLRTNSSDVAGYTRVARARKRAGDGKGAGAALREGIRTWAVLPGNMKRAQFGNYLAAQWARIAVLRSACGIVIVVLAAASLAVAGRFAYVWFVREFGNVGLAVSITLHTRCGMQSTGSFVGHYAVVAESLPSGVPAARYANFEVLEDRIRSGTGHVEEICLTRVIESTPRQLVADALHIDTTHPELAVSGRLRLVRDDSTMKMSFDILEYFGNRPPVAIAFHQL